ncbi:hypothetical protein NDU88_007843 [Pleurodeles waltl]|uniref:Uncharacterized protein n=1 Tax=Pleurodeles waltl TaxID=8319 RepID=A0AAV7NZ38_PLEWA|nr:hypothetical protein NDU88_007843 [Pleurodeles waltl]
MRPHSLTASQPHLSAASSNFLTPFMFQHNPHGQLQAPAPLSCHIGRHGPLYDGLVHSLAVSAADLPLVKPDPAATHRPRIDFRSQADENKHFIGNPMTCCVQIVGLLATEDG